MRSNIIQSIWNSATMMTWGSFLTRSLSLVAVLPLVLNKFPVEEITLWFLFSTIIVLQLIFQMGISPTFIRIISYAMAGLSSEKLKSIKSGGLEQNDLDPNWESVENITKTMRIIYLRLAICTFIFFAIFGSLFLMKPISLTEVPMESWGAWGFILIINSFSIFGNQYSDFLQGANKIAIFRRWEMLSNILSIFSSLIVLLFDGGLLGLVLASQGWRILNIIRNYYLSCFVHDGKYKRFIHSGFDLDVWNVVWPAAWRSGLGVIFSVGVVQSSGIIFAQFGEINAVASYLLGLRIINVISEFSRAPFYTKIPQLSQAWIKGDKDLTITIANKSMFKVCWIFAISVVGCGFVSPYLLSFINSNTVFPNQLLWGVMAIAFYLERVGAMHIQLYSTSNKIIWHVVNGITGCITLVALFLLIPTYGVLAYPMAMVISSLLFSLWVSMYKSYNLLELSFSTFDMKISLPPFLFILSFLIGKLT